MNETLTTIVARAAEILLPVFFGLLSLAAFRASRWLAARLKHEALRHAVERLEDAVLDAVKAQEQVVMSGLRRAAADGRIDPAELGAVKAEAIATIRSYLGTRGLDELRAIVGDEALEAMIRTKLEAAVLDAKTYSAKPTTTTVTGVIGEVKTEAPADPDKVIRPA